MSARRHFRWGWYPPVFADVGERKELRTGSVDVGEALDLRRKWKSENRKWEEDRAGRRKWKIENGKWEERRDAFNAERAEDAENAEEEGEEEKKEWGRMEDERIRIWEGIWVMGSATGKEMVERAARGRRHWENAQKDI